ncbi:MAG: 23S rRNA (guanosine(2251)-2'-O)-methyltransferase RlmB [Acidobacteria bacterium]|nr:23S rRNA (guanosine(2251)-2'-O)-methyltransferase RlmB [Acidobacteriota bacterium]MCB9399360.1 23S rRNA (guanosine(2251)-2'-O)-methyltransferase RlmB [Acidobacteriota bacterium]
MKRSHRNEKFQKKSSPDGAFFISGLNGVLECLRSPHVQVQKLLFHKSLPDILLPHLGRVEPESVADALTPLGSLVQNVAALVRPPQWPDLDSLTDRLFQEGETPLFVFLDQVQDPQNLGQIIRTAESAGAHAVVLTEHRSASLTQTAAQVSQGAFAWLPVVSVVNLRQTMDRLKKDRFWVMGCEADPQSKPWFEADFRDPSVIVLGSEGFGLRDLVKRSCDVLIRLPQAGHITSLNVSAAAAAVLFEAARQRSLK